MTSHEPLPDELAEDVRATAAAASDLGADYHDALATSLADRVEQELSRRRNTADAHVVRRRGWPCRRSHGASKKSFGCY